MKEKFMDFLQMLKKRITDSRNRMLSCAFPMTKRQKIGLWVIGVCLVIFISLLLFKVIKEGTLYDEQAAKRWSPDGASAQISCFFPVNFIEDSEYYFLNLQHTIKTALDDASIQAENDKAKQFMDAYSLTGTITIESDYGTATLQAVGVSGDFFFFHPVSLLNGSYLDGDAIMKDGIVIDEDAAWQLYGSNDIADMNVTIANMPYHITGVVDRKTGHFEDAAGLSKSVCYVPIDTLLTYGKVTGSYTYEIAMPDPVSEFAMTTVNTALNQQEEEIKLIENSKRYNFYPLLLVIRDFGARSMSRSSIVFPYWENNARAYEDVFALCLFIEIMVTVTAFILIIIYIHGLRKRIKKQKNGGEEL